jgi:hypothetical protein
MSSLLSNSLEVVLYSFEFFRQGYLSHGKKLGILANAVAKRRLKIRMLVIYGC